MICQRFTHDSTGRLNFKQAAWIHLICPSGFFRNGSSFVGVYGTESQFISTFSVICTFRYFDVY